MQNSYGGSGTASTTGLSRGGANQFSNNGMGNNQSSYSAIG